MEQVEFLESHVFKGLKSEADKSGAHYFSETDFTVVLEKAEHFGIGLYKIETLLKNKAFEVVTHENHKKKATDPKWYNKAFLTLKSKQEGLAYSATYKVSAKLLARENVGE